MANHKSAPAELRAAPTHAALTSKHCTVLHDLGGLDFQTTDEIEALDAVIEQDRAVRSLELGLSITRPNYHIYMAGPSGTGKRSQLKAMLAKLAPTRKVPNDWLYLHNFDDPDAPIALGVKAGEGKRLKKALDAALTRLQAELPAAFHSPEHQEKLQHTVAQGNMRSTDAFVELSKQAETVGFVVKTNKNDELVTLPLVAGKPLSDKEVMALPETERKQLDARREQLEPLFTRFVHANREVELRTQEGIRELQREMAQRVAAPALDTLNKDFRSGGSKWTRFVGQLQEHVLDHMERFLPEETNGNSQDDSADGPTPDPFVAFRANLVIDNAEAKGAPVVFETHPTWYRLYGKIERRVEQGIYFTDHTMIRAGSMARASGGFLICHAADLFQFPGVWENLKATLRNGEVAIEDLGESAGLLPTSGLKPEPIPLQVKIVLVGGNALYHKLYQLDDDFKKVFQVKADFDYEIRANPDSVRNYVRFVATAAKNNGCRPIDRDGVLAVLEHGARLADSQRKLTLRFNQISNLLIEADWFAGKSKSKLVTRKHVHKAIAQRTSASSLIADKMHDDLLDGQWLMDASGTAVGVINGLAVLTVGEHHFGRPFRVTARCFAGAQGIVNIEREVQMSGEIHDKGVQILSGFLGDRFAQRRPLCLTATVTFEQSYGEVDGDSASSTWLYAILSAIGGVPIDQGIGVTGSVNQLGQIQPIGGVNEKVEGFFRFCQTKKLSGRQGVLIPAQNVQHLVLNHEVREAVAKGKFHIWPVLHIEEGLEILTGVEAGQLQSDGTYPPGTLMRRVADRLDELRQHVKAPTGPRSGGRSLRRARVLPDDLEAGDDDDELDGTGSLGDWDD
jgi:lon-related putative ATP-dependent protease